MLMADKFENTTKWEGQAGQYKISGEYSSAERLMKELKGDDEDIEWYIDDGYFVIVIFGGHTDYNEYAISLQDAGLFLQKEFFNRISAFSCIIQIVSLNNTCDECGWEIMSWAEPDFMAVSVVG